MLSTPGREAKGHAIFVVGANVYVAGYESNGSRYVAFYWKNGTAVPLTSGVYNASASGIFVASDDVYVCGFEENASFKQIAKYWKNGLEVVLGDGVKYTIARSIFVSGSDVYVAGVEYDGAGSAAVYWKNGVKTVLGGGLDGDNEEASGIFVSGADVYVSAVHDDGAHYRAKYYKNGIATVLGTSETGIFANSITVVGSDIYVGGGHFPDGAWYWKNGVQGLIDTQAQALQGIKVKNNRVYGAGYKTNDMGKDIAYYWVDTETFALSDGSENARALSIFLTN